MKNFCNDLKTWRLKAKIPQRVIADKMGYNNCQFISNWERGLCIPPIKDFKKISRLLKVNIRTLVESYLANYRLDVIRKVKNEKSNKS